MTVNPQARIVVRHLSGSKINQVEQIPLKDLHEITIGRDPSSGIAYDQRRDDVVSRQHAAIRIENGDKLAFRLVDLNSSNGTMLNGERVSGEVELAPEDTVELGRGGPKFSFDVQPRPDNLAARTRVMDVMDAAATRTMATAAASAELGPNGKGTRELGSTATRSRDGIDPAKPSVGKETVMRMLFQERQKSSRVWISSLAAVVAVLIVAGGGLYWHNRSVAEQLRREAAAEAEKAQAGAERHVTQQMGSNAKEIVTKYGDSTVVVNVQWRMYDRETGQPLFHRVVQKPKSSAWYPAFVKLPSGKIVRWLTTSDGYRRNIAISKGARSGSGFVVSDQGHILTNKHVAADWMTTFDDVGADKTADHHGLVFSYPIGNAKVTREEVDLRSSVMRELERWIPEEGGYVFADIDRPVAIGGDIDSRRVFQGRNEVLEVRFPGNRVSVQANLVRASTDADAALIKIDTMPGLRPVELDQRDDDVEVGDRIMVLGYPGISSSTVIRTSSVEAGRVGTGRYESVPEPTVSEGIVQLKGRGYKDDGDVKIIGTMGDTYQMSINSTGHGNSGGPVFNTKGQVIGLFTYGQSRIGDASVTFAVPIKHGRALLNPQRSSSN